MRNVITTICYLVLLKESLRVSYRIGFHFWKWYNSPSTQMMASEMKQQTSVAITWSFEE